VTLRRVRLAIVVEDKQEVLPNSECISIVLIFQQAKSTSYIFFVVFPPLPYFLHYLINGTIFEKKILNIRYVYSFVVRLLY
jgi:hypothetical protein